MTSYITIWNFSSTIVIGKDLTWYAKNGNDKTAADAKAMIQAEIAAAKQRDEDMMNEAL